MAKKCKLPENLGKDGPHNVIFTREYYFDFIQVWDTSTQVTIINGCWGQRSDKGRRKVPKAKMSLLGFKKLFGFILPCGHAINGNMTLCGGLRTK